MRIAKIKFSEEQVRMMVDGKTVVVRTTEGEMHLTMDQTRVELRRAADKLKDIGKTKTGFEDLFGDGFDFNGKSGGFKDIFNDIMGKKK